MRIAFAALLFFSCFGDSFADNVDPNNDGSHFAWSENLGWLNARPNGPGGPGTYDSGAASQSGSRDAEIAASGNGCP